MSVTDRFLAELGPVVMGQASKDASPQYENLIKGLKHIKIKVRSLQISFRLIFTSRTLGVATRSI